MCEARKSQELTRGLMPWAGRGSRDECGQDAKQSLLWLFCMSHVTWKQPWASVQYRCHEILVDHSNEFPREYDYAQKWTCCLSCVRIYETGAEKVFPCWNEIKTKCNLLMNCWVIFFFHSHSLRASKVRPLWWPQTGEGHPLWPKVQPKFQYTWCPFVLQPWECLWTQFGEKWYLLEPCYLKSTLLHDFHCICVEFDARTANNKGAYQHRNHALTLPSQMSSSSLLCNPNLLYSHHKWVFLGILVSVLFKFIFTYL